MWIKVVSPDGAVQHINWKREYKALRAAIGKCFNFLASYSVSHHSGIEYPEGYVIHESAQYSALHRRWFFMPRFCFDILVDRLFAFQESVE